MNIKTNEIIDAACYGRVPNAYPRTSSDFINTFSISDKSNAIKELLCNYILLIQNEISINVGIQHLVKSNTDSCLCLRNSTLSIIEFLFASFMDQIMENAKYGNIDLHKDGQFSVPIEICLSDIEGEYDINELLNVDVVDVGWFIEHTYPIYEKGKINKIIFLCTIEFPKEEIKEENQKDSINSDDSFDRSIPHVAKIVAKLLKNCIMADDTVSVTAAQIILAVREIFKKEIISISPIDNVAVVPAIVKVQVNDDNTEMDFDISSDIKIKNEISINDVVDKINTLNIPGLDIHMNEDMRDVSMPLSKMYYIAYTVHIKCYLDDMFKSV